MSSVNDWNEDDPSVEPDAAAAEFDRLLRGHIPALYRSAYRWTGTIDRAEDLVQELLVRLFPQLDTLRTLDRVLPWALRVMYRIFVDQLRRERNSPVQFGHMPPTGSADDDEQEEMADAGSDPVSLADLELTREQIVSAWARLGREHRTVLALHDMEEYTLPELSIIMDLPLGTLKSRLHRARAKMREILTAKPIPVFNRVMK
jgi:RNA polymerase sigma-70 factor (ECF subfamily)